MSIKGLKSEFILDKIIDQKIKIEKIDVYYQTLGTLENQISLQSENPYSTEIAPIVRYVSVLKHLRKASQAIKTFGDEIQFSKLVAEEFSALSAVLGLSGSHFSIDNSGDAFLIKEGSGEHLISPTHFENGAYFSHPHADHHLAMEAVDLPQIHIGKYVRFGKNASVNAGGNVKIGHAAWLSPGSYLLKQDHDPFGRPSIFSRTVAMTRLPSIEVADYGWVGREAMVGWDADYIGKGSIVATRSFLNGWVGDFSITGNFGKIIQYFPYKAAVMELYDLSMDDILRITDWEKVNEIWLDTFEKFEKDYLMTDALPIIKTLFESEGKRGARLLDMNPGYGNTLLLGSLWGFQVDGVSQSRKLFPFILQRIQNIGNYNLRLRGNVDNAALPFKNAFINIFNQKTNGYDFIVNLNLPADITGQTIKEYLQEAARVANLNASIIFSVSQDYDYSELIKQAVMFGLHYEKQGHERMAGNPTQHFIIFVKKRQL